MRATLPQDRFSRRSAPCGQEVSVRPEPRGSFDSMESERSHEQHPHRVWKKRPRWRRLALAAVLIGLAFASLRWFLPQAVRAAAMKRLAPYAAGELQIRSARLLSLDSLELSGLTIRQKGRGLLVRVDKIRVRANLLRLLQAGAIPEEVTVEGVVLSSVFEEDGRWRAIIPLQLPRRPRIPRIRVRNGQIRLPGGLTYGVPQCDLSQGDVPGEVVIAARLYREGAETIDLSGTFHRFTAGARLQVHARNVVLPHPVLDQLGPLRSAADRLGLQVDGRASVRAVLVHTPGERFSTGWSIECQTFLKNSTVRVAHLPLPVEQLTGNIDYSGDGVALRDLNGVLGKGKVSATGHLGRHTSLQVQVTGVRLGDLAGRGGILTGQWGELLLYGTAELSGGTDPASWSGLVEGRLVGRALPGQELSVRSRLDAGRLTVERASMKWGGGAISLWATGSLDGGTLEGGLEIDRVRLDAISALSESFPLLNGSCSASLSWRVPLSKLGDLSSWELHGKVTVEDVETPDRYLGHATADIEKRAGTDAFSFNNLRASLFGIDVRGSVTCDLSSGACRLWLQTTRELDIRELSGLLPPYVSFPPVQGTGRITMNGTANFRTRSHAVTVIAALNQLRYGKILQAQDLTVTLSHSGTAPISFSTTPLKFAEGELVVSGELVRRGDMRWVLRGNGDFRNVDLPALLALAKGHWQTGGKSAGKLTGTAEYTLMLDPAAGTSLRGQLRLMSSGLRFGSMELADVRAQGEFTDGELTLTAWSGALSRLGPASGTLRYRRGDPTVQLTMNLKAVNLAALTASDGGEPACRGLARAALAGTYDTEANKLTLTGTAASNGLRFLRFPRTGPAQAEVRLVGDELHISDFRAAAWGGEVRGDMRRKLRRAARTEIDVRLIGTRLPDLGTRDGRQVVSSLSGIVHGTGQIWIDTLSGQRMIRGHGSFQLVDGRLGKLPVREADGTLYFDGAGYDVVFTNIRVGDGSADGTLTFTPEAVPRFEVSLSFRDISLPYLLFYLTGTRDPVAGRITGSLELRGTVGGWHTIDGVVYITRLRDADLWRLPLFDALAEFLLPGVARPGVFHDGRGRIAIEKGVMIVDGFALSGAAAQIYVRRGRIWPDGTVELEIIGNAETLIPAEMPLVGIVRRLADNVQHRLIRFYVSGTLDQPRVRALPLADVSGPAIDLFRTLMRGPVGGVEAKQRVPSGSRR